MKRCLILFLSAVAASGATESAAQSSRSSGASDIYVPREVQAAYDNGTRSEDGHPGPEYWQNGADYRIHVRFDPLTGDLAGRETIAYRNNSPEDLRNLVLKVHPNMYRKGSARDMDASPEDVGDGVTLDAVTMNGEALDPSPGAGEVSHFLNGNLLVIPGPIPAGETAAVELEWHYTVNRGSHSRTGGVETTTWFNAYTYPRIAVYDDIDGWDLTAYRGTAEFYNDFGDYDVTIEVPEGYVVWATGLLQNPDEVLAPEVSERYQAALASDEIVHLVDSATLASGAVTAMAGPSGMNAWHFRADYVPDFAFAVSDHYLWDASSLVVDPATGRRTLIDAAYHPDSPDFYEVAEVARNSIDYMSRVFPGVPFPYPQETVFNGADEMEYPMMVNDRSVPERMYMVSLTSHEIFHTYFPFYMGINEIKYAWMDEGWATFGDFFITNHLHTEEPLRLFGVEQWETDIGGWNDLPIMAGSGQARHPAYFHASYPKPAFFYLMLRDMWGEERFRDVIREYIERWNGKHPTPWDFFNTLEDVSGEDLGWLIRPWFEEYGAPDLAIGAVDREEDTYRIEIVRVGRNPVPIEITVEFEDGTSEVLNESVSAWKDGVGTHTVSVPARGEIRSIVLGNWNTPDANPADNRYPRGD